MVFPISLEHTNNSMKLPVIIFLFICTYFFQLKLYFKIPARNRQKLHTHPHTYESLGMRVCVIAFPYFCFGSFQIFCSEEVLLI